MGRSIMKYMYGNKIFDTLEEAEAYANPLIAQYLAETADRFSIVKELIDGSDTTWVAADLTTDPEDSAYLVFNTVTGRHEKVNSKTEATAKLEEIKNSFLVFSNNAVKELTDIEALAYMDILLEKPPNVL